MTNRNYFELQVSRDEERSEYCAIKYLIQQISTFRNLRQTLRSKMALFFIGYERFCAKFYLKLERERAIPDPSNILTKVYCLFNTNKAILI